MADDLERLERALRAADAAGDEEAATRIAQEIRRQNSSQDRPSALTRGAAGFNVGVAKTAGAPVDLLNAMLNAFGAGFEEPIGGSENIQRGMARAGAAIEPGREEELGRAGRVGEVAGMAAAGSAGIAGAGARAATVATRAPVGRGALPGSSSVSGRVVQDVADSAIRTPGRFAAAEGTAAAGAGLASFEASQRFPDSEGAQAIAEVAGGLTPMGAGLALRGSARASAAVFERIPLLGPMVIRNARQIVSGLTLKGGKRRAEQRVARSTEDAEASAERLDRDDVLPGLTPAQRAGDEGLLALERSVMEATPELSMARQRQFSDVNRTIRMSLDQPSQEVPTHQVKEYFQSLLDTRLSIAAQRAEERIAELGTRATREDLNRITREELTTAQSAARAQERELYQAVPSDARAPTMAAQESFQDMRLSLSAAQRSDIPPVAKRLLDPENDSFLGQETTIQELRGLQSKLREEARIARSAGKRNRARISDELADSVSEDISSAVGGAEVRESVDRAVAFSRDFNDRFTRGPVGKLLGTERTGGQSVPEGLTLEVTVGQRGPRARESTDALLEAVRRSGDEESMRGHISDFLMDDFRRAAVSGGRVDTNAANLYLSDNQDVLARFPETRRVMERAKAAGGELVEAERMSDPKVSRAAVFINAPPGKEIERVISTSRPGEAMDELVKLARQDPAGKAVEGLQAAFMQRLLGRSELQSTMDVSDTPFISGQRMSRELEDPQVVEAMSALFTPDELKRIDRIRETALILDRARTTQSSGEGVIGDAPGVITSVLGRILFAQAGRSIAQRTGGGTVQTPGIMAAQAQRLLKAGVQDPARRLLNDAVQDDELFRTLLLPGSSLDRQQAVRAKLNSWVVDVLNEQFEFEEEDATE